MVEAGHGRVGRHDWVWSDRRSEVVFDDHCTNIEYRSTQMGWKNYAGQRQKVGRDVNRSKRGLRSI